MEVKTVIAIVLVMFIVGGAIWLNIRNRKKKYRQTVYRCLKSIVAKRL